MAWIELHYDVVQNKKTDKLASALKAPKAYAVGILAALWSWAIEYAPDGELADFAPQTIASAVCWDKPAKRLIDGLLAAGYLDSADGRITIHDWSEYAGRLQNRLAADRERKAAERARKKTGQSAGSHADNPQDITRTIREKSAPTYTNTKTLYNQSSSSTPSIPDKSGDDDDEKGRACREFAENMSNARMTAAAANGISDWCDIAGAELVIEAIRHAAKQGKKPWAYVETIVRNWHEAGLKTKEDIDAYLDKRQRVADKLAGEKSYKQRDGVDLGALFEAL